MSQAVSVVCRPEGDGWSCHVRVGSDAGATQHEVSVSRAELATYAPGADDPTRLVEASFAFLLGREPRESILRHFSLSTIERYFPAYRADIASRG